MHRRGLRYGLLVLLFAVAAGAGAYAWMTEGRARALADAARADAAHFDALVQSVASFDVAQQTYGAARESEAAWFRRIERLLQGISTDAAALQHGAEDPANAPAGVFAAAAGRMTDAVARAEENFRAGRELMAADLVQDEGKPAVDAMRTSLLEWRTTGAAAIDAERSRLARQSWMAIGGAAALWAVGLLLFAGGRKSVTPASSEQPPSLRPEPEQQMTPAASPSPIASDVDLGSVAILCGHISQATDPGAVSTLLARASSALRARGIVVWMKGGDHTLVPAAAHGYDEHVVSHMREVSLDTSNATTAAWHSGIPQTVAGDGRANGALAVPMFSGAACTGVFAVELGGGRERDPRTRALTAIVAAQFAAAIQLPATPATAPAPGESAEPAGDAQLHLEATGS